MSVLNMQMAQQAAVTDALVFFYSNEDASSSALLVEASVVISVKDVGHVGVFEDDSFVLIRNNRVEVFDDIADFDCSYSGVIINAAFLTLAKTP